VSACRTNADFHQHPVRREVFLIDQYEESSNHDAVTALEDAVDSIDAFLEEDPSRGVVVHCHGGRSRTAFILKAWAMRRHGFDEERAHAWLVKRWPRAHRDNPVVLRILREEWPRRSRARQADSE
jgi:ADP-ribosyl-[dinitrogen reductase] hydrolase